MQSAGNQSTATVSPGQIDGAATPESPYRQGMEFALDKRTYFVYLVCMGLVFLPFLTEGARRVTGLELTDIALFVAIHLTGTTANVLRGRPYPFSTAVNPLLTALLPFLSEPFSPLAWLFFLLSAVNDALILRPRLFHRIVLAGTPGALWIVFTLGPGTAVSPASVVMVTMLGYVLHEWANGIMEQYSALAGDNLVLRQNAARLAERKRIGNDLFDWLSANLTGLALRSRLVARSLEEKPSLAAESLADMEEMARAGLHHVRTAMKSLLYETLTPDDFASLLRSVIREIPGMRVKLSVEDDVGSEPAAPFIAHHLLLFAVEILNFSAASGVKDVFVTFGWSERRWILEVGALDGDLFGARKLPARIQALRGRARMFEMNFDIITMPDERRWVRLMHLLPGESPEQFIV